MLKSENINHEFLDRVVAGDCEDVYYHFGVTSADPSLDALRGIRAVIMAGSGERTRELARQWSEANGGATTIAFPKEDRFVTRYVAGVLFCSHGMGMPSASIAVQEMMRMVHFLKRGDLAAMDGVFWARVGTSGGIGVPAGTVVATSEGVMADLKPYRVLRGNREARWFDGRFPEATRAAILRASEGSGIRVVEGRTVAANDFFIEQFRLDGAIRFETADSRQAALRWLHENGVRNIEMEGAMLAGCLNHWGFSSFAMICAVLLDRLEGDQVAATAEQLHAFTANAGVILFRYLAALPSR